MTKTSNGKATGTVNPIWEQQPSWIQAGICDVAGLDGFKWASSTRNGCSGSTIVELLQHRMVVVSLWGLCGVGDGCDLICCYPWKLGTKIVDPQR